MKKNSDQLLYIPNKLFGKCLFNGRPEPTNDVIDLIGESGVKNIHKKLSHLLGLRKELFGKGNVMHFGFFHLQYFLDLESKFRIEALQIIDSPSKTSKISYKLSVGESVQRMRSKHKPLSDEQIRRFANTSLFSVDEEFIPPRDLII